MLKILSAKSTKLRKIRVKINNNGKNKLNGRNKLDNRDKFEDKNKNGNDKFDSNKIRDNKIITKKNH